MNRKIQVLALLTLACLLTAGMVFAQENPKAAAWIEDIDYLINRLEVQHPNLYANVAEAELKQFGENLKVRVPMMTDQQVVFAIHELIALVEDVHTSVAPWKSQDPEILTFFDTYRILFYPFSDGIFVAVTSDEDKEIVGKKVLKFGNLKAEETLVGLSRIISADNRNGKVEMADVYLSVAGGLEYIGVENAATELELTLANEDGSIFNYTVKPGPFMDALGLIIPGRMGHDGEGIVRMNNGSKNPLPIYLSKPNDAYWYTYIPEHKTLYVSLLEMEPREPGDFDRFWAELLKEFDDTGAEKMVLDVRNNGGGDHYELSLMKGIIARPHLDQTDKLFVIVGRITTSASQHFATQFSMYTNATFVGEDSGGRPNHYGAQRFFELPHSKLPIRSSIIFHQDETEWAMADCARPSFYTPLSSTEFRSNQDPALDLIFNFNNVKNLEEQFRKQLSETYTNGTYVDLEESYFSFIQEYGSTGISKGMLISNFTWWLSANKKSMEDYTAFLELFTEECPHWTESWYRLARRMQLSGKIDMAEDYFNKSLEVFPGNTLAQRRLALMLFEKENDK